MQSLAEPSRRLHNPLLIAIGVFALAWIVARAYVQSITIDEADTYLDYVSGARPSYWVAMANNHLLNSMLMRLFVSVFGLHHITARAPALIGAIIYLSASYFLARHLARELTTQVLLFVSLVFNPFVMDHLVAARGYSLALGLLLAGVCVALSCVSDQDISRTALTRLCGLCSICAGLSCCSNLASAIVNASLIVVLFVHSVRRWAPHWKGALPRFLWGIRLAAACAVPGLLVVFFLAGSILPHLPKDQLVYGARSVRETAMSVVNSSVYEPNPFIVAPLFYPYVLQFGFYILPALAVIFLCRVASILAQPGFAGKRGADSTSNSAIFVGGVAFLALSIHRLLYRLFHLPLPLNRTAVYLAPLIMLLVGIAMVVPGSWSLDRFFRRSLAATMGMLAFYFMICLRLGYFKEWRYHARVNDAYAVISKYNCSYAFEEVSANWRYVAVLNFYRVLSHRESLREVPPGPADPSGYPLDKFVYAVYSPSDMPFAKRENLKVVYTDDETGIAVAIRPELESLPRPVRCAEGN